MKKSTAIIILGIVLVLMVSLVLIFKNSSSKKTTLVEDNTQPDLPINVMALAERPFITLSPDPTGRSLNITIDNALESGSIEYEMIYNASGKQEGALGTIYLGSEKQPITKAILLGSKSGGGKVTYHEGVTGGSITLTYDTTRLKESWNYLHFDPADPTFSSTDGKFSVTLPKTALKKDAVIVTMKTFGLPAEALAKEGYPGKVIVGPYGYFTQTSVKSLSSVELKLPAGQHENPTIYGWDGKTWSKLKTTLTGDSVSAVLPAQAGSTSHVFLVTAE